MFSNNSMEVARLKMVVLAVGGDGGDDGEVVVMVLVDVVVAAAGLWWWQSWWLWCEGGGGNELVRVSMVMMLTVVAGCGCRRGWRRVAASGYGDRVDRVMRITFGFSRNTRRKTFPAAAAGRREGWPEILERESVL
ncbi:hypothetical protein Tco_0000816 [Tanacetum coccineum]